MNTFIKIIISLLLIIFLVSFFLVIPFVGWHYECGQGEHTGYITAIQKQGIFFKTGRAYIKTDVSSSQEDAYCVVDDNVFNQLKELSEKKEKVTVKYLRWIASGIKNCEGEGEVIYEVKN